MKQFIVCLSIVILSSCTSSTRIIKSETAEGVNLSQYKTFDFYKLEASGDTVSAKFEQRTAMLKSAIADELIQKSRGRNNGQQRQKTGKPGEGGYEKSIC